MKDDEKKISDAQAATLYRLAQARELLGRFREAHGREPTSIEETEAWLEGQPFEGSVKPRPEFM